MYFEIGHAHGRSVAPPGPTTHRGVPPRKDTLVTSALAPSRLTGGAWLAVVASLMLLVVGCSSAPTSGFTAVPAAPVPAASVASAPATSVPATAAPTTSTPATSAAATLAATPTPASSATGLGFTPGTKAAPRLIQIDSNNALLFAPNFLVVAAGETVTFEIGNTGSVTHEFMVGPQQATFANITGTPEVADITAGTTKTLTYTFTGPGPFAFACHAVGHFEQGMLGYIQVVGPGVPTVGTATLPRIVPITMTDALKFDPATAAVAPGETVSFVLFNGGVITHEFQVGPEAAVAANKVDGKTVVEVADITGKHVAELTYKFPASGAYAFACHVPGHYEAGMKGTVTLP
jgi:uncharacterized cupredoxin-like copper-binding protein